jgi:dienelactone hydrolase
MTDWELPGSNGLPIRGTTQLPVGDPRAAVVVVHGYLGFKEYGMFPWIAAKLCSDGHIVHRVNLSHSGMDHGNGPFDNDVIVKDTWSRGVEDISLLSQAIDRGVLAGDGSGVVLFGHSRGGATCLLTAGRHALDEAMSPVVGVVSLSSPASLRRMSSAAEKQLLADGTVDMPSSRTGQTLHVGRAWLQEQIDDPTVSASDAVTIAQANPSRSMVHLVEDGDHVFNTPNPFAANGDPSPQLAEVMATASAWIDTWVQ